MKPPANQEFVIASHVLTFGASQALRDHLQARGRRAAFIACPLGDAAAPRAAAAAFVGREKVWERAGHGHRVWRGPALWLRDALFAFAWGWRLGGRETVWFGVDNLNAAVGLILRACGRCRRVVYYVIDYTPRRFKSRALNAFYQALCRFAARRADAVWNLSERMREVHARFGTRPERNRIVPIGLIRDFVRVAPESEIEARRLIVVSTLYENKGVQLALRALPSLPGARLVIVGDGPYAPALRELAAELGVAGRVEFRGMLEQGPELFGLIATSRLALATYVPDPDSYTYYADPTKPKEYLACGTPVVITRVPWIAEQIESGPMGAAVEYEPQALAAACRRLLDDEMFWRRCREKALEFTRDLAWDAIFTEALADLEAR